MKASLLWLRALVPGLPDDPAEVARRFTAAGVAFEGMHAYGEGADKCVVARVVSMRPHPSRGQLRLVTVDCGGGTQQEVVCGAPNVPDPGGLVVLAPLGTHLPAKGMTIERRAIGGITSEGMLCSEQELGLTEEAAGIMVLPPGFAEPGTPLAKREPGVRDTIFDVDLTPNRPDCLGHIGLAREAAALFGLAWTPPPPDPPVRHAEGKPGDFIKVEIQDAERCPHYLAAVLFDATVGPSPLWMRYRLASLGVRPISNAVDITNLVLLEYGHPMHAFDLDKIAAKRIVVRRAKQGERLRTLDGVDRALSPDDLVICDGDTPTGLGGVMGGGDSEISASTKRVLLECAYFEPRGVRRTARRHGLHTEASHRFERGVDHGDTEAAILRGVSLVSAHAGGSAVRGVLAALGREIPKRVVGVRHARMEGLLGTPVPRAEAVGILERLGFKRTTTEGDADVFDVPTHRPDVAREADLVEEVGRVHGFDKIPAVLPAIHASRDVGGREEAARRARAVAVDLGLSEIVAYGFTSPRALATFAAPAATVVLKNPINENHTVMRTSLLPGLFDAVAHARRHGERDVRLFTVGTTFLAPAKAGDELPDERLGLAVVLAGDRPAYLSKPQPHDVWDAKGAATELVERFAGRPAVVEAYADEGRPGHLHPRGAARVLAGGREVGRFGPVHPDVMAALDLDGEAYVVEIDVGALEALGRAVPQYRAIPRFPAATRDIALVVPDGVPAGDVERAVREAAGKLAEEVCLFDRFTGGAVPKDHSSLALHVVYRAEGRTLTDQEVDVQHAKVVAEVGKRFGATLRS
jgi:phenylalanyl-tRNA synthetase beta chain